MNDLNPCACCHISDKVGGNEKPGAYKLLVFHFSRSLHVEFAPLVDRLASHVYGRPLP